MKDILFFLSYAGMELSWMVAWANFMLLEGWGQRAYPLSAAVASLGVAAFITRFHRGRGWRVIEIIGIHLLGGVVLCVGALHVFKPPRVPFWHIGWLSDFWDRPRELAEWILIWVVLGWTVAFWTTGIRIIRRPPTYWNLCTRFDVGVSAFICLTVSKLILRTQMGAQLQEPTLTVWVFPFFIFGLLAVGSARSRGEGQRDFLTGYRGLGVFAGFSFGILLFGAGIILFFLPYLTAASEAGYGLLKDVARPLAPILIVVIRFLFGYAKSSPAPPRFASTQIGEEFFAYGEAGGWMGLVEKVVMWGAGALYVMVGVVGSVFVVGCLVRWLFRRRPVEDSERIRWRFFPLWYWIEAFWEWLGRHLLRPAKKGGAGRYFASLLRWGRRKGIVLSPYETALEYGDRLARHCPSAHSDIALVVEQFNRETYGQMTLSPEEMRAVRQAVHRCQILNCE